MSTPEERRNALDKSAITHALAKTRDDPMRDDLIRRSNELGCFPDPENHTDEQLYWAIRAEEAATRWMARYEALPEEAQRDAAHRLRLNLETHRGAAWAPDNMLPLPAEREH